MFKHCHFVKTLYYICLISYHVFDCYVYWRGYHVSKNDGEFIVIPKNDSISSGLYLLSCISGSVFSSSLVIIYCFYVCYHLSCVFGYIEDYTYESYNKRGCGDCLSCFNNLELFISVLEFILKESIQSILFLLIHANIKCVISSLTKAFAACRIGTQLKHLVCFSSKLFGCGSGEGCNSCVNGIFCFLGSVGSSIFLALTCLKLFNIHRVVPQLENLLRNCTQS